MARVDQLIAHLQTLTGFPTVTGDQATCKQCIDYLHDQLSPFGLHINTIQSGGYTSLIATTQPTTKPKLLLQAHIDVVPASREGFLLKESDGKLYGRGVYDMKFAAAAYLALVEELGPNLAEYDFGIMFTSDEELGGRDGVGYLLDKGYGAEVCILPDSGNNWHIESSCNGGWWLALTARGKAAHGSRPWEGQNAIVSLLSGLHEIQALFADKSKDDCSLTISQVSGGTAVNQVPDQAEATLDIRFRTNPLFDELRSSITQIAKRYHLAMVSHEKMQATTVDLTENHTASYIAVAESVLGQKIKGCHSLGGSDARYLRQNGIPTIMMRPEGGGAHSDNEWVSKQGLSDFYKILKRYVVETAKLP